LKPSNILVNGKGHALIGDFGTSRIVSDDATASGGNGTVCYTAPELCQEGTECTSKSDVFSFGLILYEILTGKPVFDPSELPLPILKPLRARDLPRVPAQHGSFMKELKHFSFEELGGEPREPSVVSRYSASVSDREVCDSPGR
jgi:serine/threonine-protein kinase